MQSNFSLENEFWPRKEHRVPAALFGMFASCSTEAKLRKVSPERGTEHAPKACSTKDYQSTNGNADLELGDCGVQ